MLALPTPQPCIQRGATDIWGLVSQTAPPWIRQCPLINNLDEMTDSREENHVTEVTKKPVPVITSCSYSSNGDAKATTRPP